MAAPQNKLQFAEVSVLFADSFDTDTSANWSLFWGAANGIADYTADWAFDYGATPYTFNGVTGLSRPRRIPPTAARAVCDSTVNKQ